MFDIIIVLAFCQKDSVLRLITSLVGMFFSLWTWPISLIGMVRQCGRNSHHCEILLCFLNIAHCKYKYVFLTQHHIFPLQIHLHLLFSYIFPLSGATVQWDVSFVNLKYLLKWSPWKGWWKSTLQARQSFVFWAVMHKLKERKLLTNLVKFIKSAFERMTQSPTS